MGNKVTLNPQIPILREEEWEEVQSEQIQHPEFGEFRTLRNEYTGQLIDEYRVDCIDEEDYKTYLDSFIWRLKEPNIVRTMYLKQEHREQFCSKTYMVKVYIQHIGTRFSDITDIPYPQNLYVCMCALDGYNKLYDNLHYFRVQQNQICVDSEGQVRIWLNSDLSKNYPNINQETQGTDETSMVQQIIDLIAQNTDQDSEPVSLREYFNNNSDRAVGFEQAKIIVRQYARQQNVTIPECFESILEIYQKQEEYSNGMELQNRNEDSRHVGKMSRISNEPQSSRFKNAQPYHQFNKTSAINTENQIINTNKVQSPFQPANLQSYAHSNHTSQQNQLHPVSSYRTQGMEYQSNAIRHTFRDQSANGNAQHNPINNNNSEIHRVNQQKLSPILNSTIPVAGSFFKPVSMDINPYRPFQQHHLQQIRVPQSVHYGYQQSYPHFYPPQYYTAQLRPPYFMPSNQPMLNTTQPVNRNNYPQNQNLSFSPPKPHSPSPFTKSPLNKPNNPLMATKIDELNKGRVHSIPISNEQPNQNAKMLKQLVNGNILRNSEEKFMQEVLSEQSKRILSGNRIQQIKKKQKQTQWKHTQNNNKEKQHHHAQTEGEKAYYYTIDTEEELDPQIAADLRKMYPVQ